MEEIQILCQYNTKQLYDYEFMMMMMTNLGEATPASSIICTFVAVLQGKTGRGKIPIGSRAYNI